MPDESVRGCGHVHVQVNYTCIKVFNGSTLHTACSMYSAATYIRKILMFLMRILHMYVATCCLWAICEHARIHVLVALFLHIHGHLMRSGSGCGDETSARALLLYTLFYSCRHDYRLCTVYLVKESHLSIVGVFGGLSQDIFGRTLRLLTTSP